jgi:hypothetical protein
MAELLTSDRHAALARRPALTVEEHPSGGGWFVAVRRLCPEFIITAQGGRLESLLRVTVADVGAPDDDLPGISGERTVVGDEVRFFPDFPFESGVQYRAILDLGGLGQAGLAGVLIHEFSFPKESPTAEPEVSQAFPSSEVLPENLLRFYIRFSNPMRRGHAADNIEVLGSDGRPTPDVLYRAPVELWDGSMTCLTILFDPGRLKRGVGPNRVLGPPLEVGERYTLAISSGMIDIHGRPLRQGFRKSFTVSEAVREAIAINNWMITPPSADSREPLEITFARPLDWAQLWQGITVASEGGERISGRVDITKGETRWHFTPDAPWRKGSHSVRVSPNVEDACGNTPYSAFDGSLRTTDEMALESAVRSIPFEVKPT